MEESIDYNELIAQAISDICKPQQCTEHVRCLIPQFQNVLNILKDCLREMEEKARKSTSLDPEMLNLAMGFLSLEE